MNEEFDEEFALKNPYSDDNLKRIKKKIERSYKYFEPSYTRYTTFKRFTYKSTLTDSDLTLADALNQPQVECNVGEAYISRLRGEFAKQEPSVTVTSQDDNRPVDTKLIDFIEGCIRHILFKANNDGFEWEVYDDELSGGMGVIKVITKYINEMSFNQELCLERKDPLMTGFDMNATLPHKGDGEFSYDVMVLTKEEFKRYWPKKDISKMKFSNALAGFNWSYTTIHEDLILVAAFYEKRHKRTRIVKAANGRSFTLKEYKQHLENWELEGRIEQPPIIVDERWTDIVEICRYFVIEDEILKYEETDLPGLPHIYVGGNTQIIRDNLSKSVEELSKPYLYNIYDLQKSKNLAFRVICNQMENIVQHKWAIAMESIPDEDDYRRMMTNVQNPGTLVYRAFLKTNPSMDNTPIPIPPPREIPLVSLPPEVMQFYQVCDQTIQTVLGSYDAALGINDNQLSGLAIIEAATQSNAAAMPYIKSYLIGLNQAAQLLLQLIPKYYKTSPNSSRSVSILDKQGKSQNVKIGGKDGLNIEYSPRDLNIKVEAGVNFSIQKNRALQQIIALSQASQQFNQFINQKGLSIILDNMEVRGVDQLKEMAHEWMEEQEKMAEQAAKAGPQNPQLIKAQADMMKAQTDAKMSQIEAQLKTQQLRIDEVNANNAQMSAHNNQIRIMLDAKAKHDNNAVQLAKAQTERDVQGAGLHLQHHDMNHRHNKENEELALKQQVAETASESQPQNNGDQL